MRCSPPASVFAASMLSFVACGSDGTTSSTGRGGASSGSAGPSTSGAQVTSSSTTNNVTSTGANSSTSTGTMNGTAGCGISVTDPEGQWSPKTVDVAGTMRSYFVYLPPGYDPTRPYPVIYQFHGCSGSVDKESNNVPIETQSAGNAILVRGRAIDNCWDTSAAGPDVAFFDAMVVAVEGGYCADTTHRLIAGYSSGSFMTHKLACIRGSELRGVASIAGGQTGSSCTGNVAALLIHDANDPTVNISASIGARDQYLAANGCGTTTTAFDPAPCVAYDGCNAGLPVVWCQTSGKGHDRQDALAAPAFWNFFSKL